MISFKHYPKSSLFYWSYTVCLKKPETTQTLVNQKSVYVLQLYCFHLQLLSSPN